MLRDLGPAHPVARHKVNHRSPARDAGSSTDKTFLNIVETRGDHRPQEIVPFRQLDVRAGIQGVQNPILIYSLLITVERESATFFQVVAVTDFCVKSWIRNPQRTSVARAVGPTSCRGRIKTLKRTRSVARSNIEPPRICRVKREGQSLHSTRVVF